MTRNIVVKDNALVNASYQLDLVEQRLILLAIAQSRKEQESISANKKISIKASSYMNCFNVVKSTAYQALRDACKSLFYREFSFIDITKSGKEKITQSRWVSAVSYIDHDATVEIFFSPTTIPFISNLEKRFTSYDLKQVSNLTSSYATRLYEILISWKHTQKTPLISLVDLRKKLGIAEQQYKKMTNFKARVLDLGIQQINEHTDISVNYTQHTSGRKILGFSFNLTFKNHPDDLTKYHIEQYALPGESYAQARKRLSKSK